jgi:hypothetical protein
MISRALANHTHITWKLIKLLALFIHSFTTSKINQSEEVPSVFGGYIIIFMNIDLRNDEGYYGLLFKSVKEFAYVLTTKDLSRS